MSPLNRNITLLYKCTGIFSCVLSSHSLCYSFLYFYFIILPLFVFFIFLFSFPVECVIHYDNGTVIHHENLNDILFPENREELQEKFEQDGL